jgi:hypothetical protein
VRCKCGNAVGLNAFEEEFMKIARLASFVLVAAAAVVLEAGAARPAMKTQWIDYKQGNTPLYGYFVYGRCDQNCLGWLLLWRHGRG